MTFRRLDIACALFIVWAGVVHYAVPLAQAGMTWDAFLITCLMDEGKLPWFTLWDLKEPGRPFVALPWWIARELLGGSVTGYNLFAAACLCLTPLVIYVLVRVAAPQEPHWAFLAASIKVFWPGDLQVWYNFSLHVDFVELLYCVATLLLVSLHRGVLGSRRSVRFALLASLVAAVSVVVGSYQTTWPLVLLTPLPLLAAPRRGGGRATAGVACWYFAGVAWMLFSLYLSLGFIGRRPLVIGSCLGNLGQGLRAVFWDVNVRPVAHALHGGDVPGWPTAALAGAFGVLALWTARGAAFRCPGRACRPVLAVAALGVAAIVATLLPPSLLHPPLYGTRLVRWASYGSILSLVAACAALPTRRWRIAACLALMALFAAWSHELTTAGNQVAAKGKLENSFWEGLVRLTQGLDEDTIVVVDGRLPGLDVGDEMCTAILRQFTNTRRTFLLIDGVPSRDGEDAVLTTTRLDLERTGRGWLREQETATGSPKMRLPRLLRRSRFVRLPLDRVMLLRWQSSVGTLEWAAGRPLRMATGEPRGFGVELFPGARR